MAKRNGGATKIAVLDDSIGLALEPRGSTRSGQPGGLRPESSLPPQ
jgi:hypothetical protein